MAIVKRQTDQDITSKTCYEVVDWHSKNAVLDKVVRVKIDEQIVTY
ncbi:hypothetical protein G15_0940 [Enterococcus avium]|nr:hypothetical protein G15_0940 [Enterococcus avium]